MNTKLIKGDALEKLREMVSESVDAIITSPPYYLQRDYGVEGQIGHEETHWEYIKKLIDVFNEAKRVLKKEGTCFVNLGDTFAGSGFGSGGDISDEELVERSPLQSCNLGTRSAESRKLIGNLRKNNKVFPAKSLMLIPHRFAIAMIESGWICRNDLIWIKRNAMPESMQDRWKRAHEHIFFFVKSRKYYFNLDAVRTPHKQSSVNRLERARHRVMRGLSPEGDGVKYKQNKNKNRGAPDVYYSVPSRMTELNPKGATPPDFFEVTTNSGKEKTTKEHYATYPPGLIIPLISAGCPSGGTVLDPFCGSGTTGVVAKKLKRNFIGIDISEKYINVANRRIEDTPEPLL